MCSEKPKLQSSSMVSKLTLFEDLLDSESSDCESGISGPENEQASGNGLIRIWEGEMVHEVIKKKLESSSGSARVESIHRIDYSSIMSRAKVQSFCIYSKAMEMKCGGSANVKYAWYGASKAHIDGILSHGFGFPARGKCVHLSPVEHPAESLQFAEPDENGVKYMLLCRVIMGKMEQIRSNSDQCNPSTEEFDSGVDNLASARKYIVWSTRMNTHILPEFLVSFRASSPQRGNQTNLLCPKSDWMSFPNLIIALSNFLPPDTIESISKHHNNYIKRKITRHEMIQRVRQMAGDRLLMATIKSYRGKMKSFDSRRI